MPTVDLATLRPPLTVAWEPKPSALLLSGRWRQAVFSAAGDQRDRIAAARRQQQRLKERDEQMRDYISQLPRAWQDRARALHATHGPSLLHPDGASGIRPQHKGVLGAGSAAPPSPNLRDGTAPTGQGTGAHALAPPSFGEPPQHQEALPSEWMDWVGRIFVPKPQVLVAGAPGGSNTLKPLIPFWCSSKMPELS